LRHLKGDKVLIIDQKNASGVFNYKDFFKPAQPIFENITKKINLNWQHKENSFVDFNQQPLIPHELSEEGPRIAVADVNRDGLEDFFACGARGQAGALFIQTSGGGFKLSAQNAFADNAESEGVDAVFLDANNDGFPDLLVVSGGNELPNGSPLLTDHLYLNDGKGNFTLSKNTIPSINVNKAAVAVADVNHDGFPDIFIAGAPDARKYGEIPESYLLMNDGHGHFSPSALTKELKFAGMVRSATFSDLDGDGWPDLVVAGEWMPVKVFMNKKGKFVQQHNPEMDKLYGWWQRVAVMDVDGDGKPDIVAGNYGLNSKLKPDEDNPVKLYLSDIDKDGTVDPLLTYSISKKEYTFLGKGEIEKQVPLLKKKFLYYHDFAGKTVDELFGDSLTGKTWTASSFTSGVFYNKGKGNFEFRAFPKEMQTSPLFGFAAFSAGDKGKGILAGGNFYGVLPYEGRYDADYGDVLFTGADKKFSYRSPASSGFLLRGEVRDIKGIKTPGGLVYVVALSNKELQFFKIKR